MKNKFYPLSSFPSPNKNLISLLIFHSVARSFKEKISIIGAYALVCIVWSTTWAAIRLGVVNPQTGEHLLPPVFAAGLRFIIAFLILLVIVFAMKIKIPFNRETIGLYFIVGVFGYGLAFALTYMAAQRIPTGLGAIIFCTFPFFITFFSRLMIENYRIPFLKILGILIGFSGIIYLFHDTLDGKSSFTWIDVCFMLISSLSQAFSSVNVKKKIANLHPVAVIIYPSLIAGVLLFITSFFTEDYAMIKQNINFHTAGTVLYLSVFGSIIAFWAYFWLFKKIDIIIVSLTSFITPILTMMVGNIVLKETLTKNIYFGSALVFSGLVVANLAEAKRFSGRILNRKNIP